MMLGLRKQKDSRNSLRFDLSKLENAYAIYCDGHVRGGTGCGENQLSVLNTLIFRCLLGSLGSC